MAFNSALEAMARGVHITATSAQVQCCFGQSRESCSKLFVNGQSCTDYSYCGLMSCWDEACMQTRQEDDDVERVYVEQTLVSYKEFIAVLPNCVSPSSGLL